MILNDNLQCELQNKIEEAKGICTVQNLTELVNEMEEILIDVNQLFEGIEEYLNVALYQEWQVLYVQLIGQVEKFSGYIADDYNGCLDTIAMNVREELDDTGEPDFGDKIAEAAQREFEEQEEKKVEILESILNVFDEEEQV